MVELLHMDCMDYMKDVKDKFFELAIVDPPYGIGSFTNERHTGTDGIRRVNQRQFANNYEWNEYAPDEKYFYELRRVSINQIIWGANYFNCFHNGNGSIVWYKGNQARTVSHCEIASISNQQRVDYVHINWQPGFFRKNIQGEPIHPCQKPVKLYAWLLKNYAKPGDKILDTHGGSGSSAIAAHKLGFDMTWIEIDSDYYNAALKRFKKETAMPLFDKIEKSLTPLNPLTFDENP